MQAKLSRIVPLTGALVLALTLTGACSSSSPPADVASISGSNQAGDTKAPDLNGTDQFTKCMKENGAEAQSVEIPQDGSGQGTLQQTAAPQVDQAAREKALEKCRQFLPDGGNPRPMSAAELEQARAFAKCMRAAGVDYPDPDPNASGGDGVAKIPDGVDFTDPAIQQKLTKCTEETSNGSVAGGSTK